MTKTETLNAAIAKGQVVTVASYTRAFTVTPRTAKSWTAAGYPFFMTDHEGATRMITRTRKGKPIYDIIDFCRITLS